MHRPLGLLLLLAVMLAPLAHASDVEPDRALYLRLCGACHGPEGHGDGIAGTFMRPKPTDLTTIAKRNGGDFPYEQVMRQIDGRQTVRAHGDPEMPVWGDVLQDRGSWDVSRRIEVRGKLLVLVEYLRSIQQP